MIKDNKHLLVKNYIKNHSPVESNIKSFNDFIERRMQEIVDEVSKEIQNEEDDFEITLGKISVEKPVVIEAEGSKSLLTPTQARLRNLTYSAPIKLEITIKKDDKIETDVVEIGKIPVMVKSKACNLYGLSNEEIMNEYFDDPNDPGGYFIINGNERVMVLAEDLAENQPFIEGSNDELRLRIFSLRGTYRIPVTISEDKKGNLNITFTRFKDIPAIVILKALGMTQEAEISKLIGKESDSLIVNFYEFAHIGTREEALKLIADKVKLQGTEEEVLRRIEERIDSYLLPHIGVDKEVRMKKAVTICKLIKKFLKAKENPEIRTDKDHYSNKRIRLSGDLLTNLFRVNLRSFVRDMKYSLQKASRRNKQYSIKTIAKSTLFSRKIESAIATGSWIGDRKGITQNMDKTNRLSVISQLQKVSSMLPSEQENFMARTLHPTHYGRFCPIETPEGTEIGLRKNLALLGKISTRVKMEKEELLSILKEIGLKEEDYSEGSDVFIDGVFVGTTDDMSGFVKEFREKRRNGEIPHEISISENSDLDTIRISIGEGRVLRPLIIVENGVPKLTEEHLIKLEEGSLDWNGLLKEGVIEYLDASEEENALVALYPEELTPEHTHLEIDPIDLLGVITSLVPFCNHDQSSRLLRVSKAQKQSIGLYAANYHSRLDTDVGILEYPQKPIVRSFVYDSLNIYPAGQNIIVAIVSGEGYSIDDAIVMNKGSVDRGLGRSFFFRPYNTVEMNYAGGLKDEIKIPDKDVTGYRTEESYRLLEEDGIASPESEAKPGEVLIGKESPPKFLSESREISIRTKKESSVTMRQEEEGVVDSVFITVDDEGNKIVQVKTRDQRVPEIGDKFATPHGQKGVIGFLMPEQDIPFTVKGIKPDILFNPHGIPSRMTAGYLLDAIAGKVAALTGQIIDGTAFSHVKKEDLEEMLEEIGFRYDGKETMYHGITGKKMDIKIFVGNIYYLKLKYMVKNKIHGRASGKIALLTRQPVEGRARGGALRLGEMEQQALIAHGASLLLKERYSSDNVVIHVCDKCGAIAIEDHLKHKKYCPICKSEEVSPVEVSYAFKLLIEELQGLHIHTTFELKNKYDED